MLNGNVDLIGLFEQVQDRYLEDGNDKLKLLVLLCSEDDELLQRAAAGALAMLTAAQKKLAVKITKVVCTLVYTQTCPFNAYVRSFLVIIYFLSIIRFIKFLLLIIHRLSSGLKSCRDCVSMTTLKFSTEAL